jgi:hypothetical protein
MHRDTKLFGGDFADLQRESSQGQAAWLSAKRTAHERSWLIPFVSLWRYVK